MSFILSSLIRKRVPDWNSVVFNEDRLVSTSEAAGARVIWAEIRSRGEYLVYQDQPFIVVRRDLGFGMRPWVLAHELGHHILHAVTHTKFSRGLHRRLEREANYFAAIALIPTFTLPRVGELFEEFNYPRELFAIRQEIQEVYGI